MLPGPGVFIGRQSPAHPGLPFTRPGESPITIWTYRLPFELGTSRYRVEFAIGFQAYTARLFRGETLVTEQRGLFAAGYGNPRLALHDEEAGLVSVEVGYISWRSAGIEVRQGEALLYASHPGRDIHVAENSSLFNALPTQDPAAAREAAERWERNKYSILADLGLGALFFVVGKLTGDLTMAALVGAAAGLALVGVQRFVRVDLLGGFAVFGTIMLLVSAVFSLLFQSEYMVQMKSTILGVATALLFFGDGLLRRGAYFGERMQRYMPAQVSVARMAMGLGFLGLFMAGANYLVATYLSEDFWLTYTTFLDMPLSIGGAYAVYFWARAGVDGETGSRPAVASELES